MFSSMSWLGPLASLLIFLVAFCNPVLLPLLPQAKLLAFPGHSVVTQPVVSSIHNEQLVECSTSPLKNVAPRISVTLLYTWEDRSQDIPASETTNRTCACIRIPLVFLLISKHRWWEVESLVVLYWHET